MTYSARGALGRPAPRPLLAATIAESASSPGDPSLTLYVREAFPAPGYGTDITGAAITHATITSEMSNGGVIFGDGIEDDFLRFTWGRRAII